MLTTKNQMKNAIGEQNTTTLGRWAVLMCSTALSRCGLPVEALECLSPSHSMFSGSEPKNTSDNLEPKILNEKLNPCSSSSNWISADVALHTLLDAKYSFAMQYISNLLTEHPSWPGNVTPSSEIQYKTLLLTFGNKLHLALAYFVQKYSLIHHHMINMIIVFLCNHSLMFIGSHILRQECFALNENPSYPSLHILVLKATENFSYFFSRYHTVCMMNCHVTEPHFQTKMVIEGSCSWLSSCKIYMKDLLLLVSKIKSGLKLLDDSSAENFLDLCEFYIYFASAWLPKVLFLF